MTVATAIDAAGLGPLAGLPSWLTDAGQGDRVRDALVGVVEELAGAHQVAIRGQRLRLKRGHYVAEYDVEVDGRQVALAGTLTAPGSATAPPEVNGSFSAAAWSCLLPEIGLRLWTRPDDDMLPALDRLVDPASCRDLLEDAFRSGSPSRDVLRIAACDPRVVRYKYGSRCTIVIGMTYASGADGPDPVIAKTYRGGKGENAYAGMRALWASPLRAGDVVAIAEPLAYVPDLRLLLQGPVHPGPVHPGPIHRSSGAAPGAGAREQTLEDLLKTSVTTGEPAVRAALDRSLRQAAQGLAALHGCAIDYGGPVEIADEIDEIREVSDRVARVAPATVGAVEPLLAQLEERAVACPSDPLAPAHRSFRPAQVLLAEGRIAFIDFDGVCRAEPALDIALFRTAVRSIGLKLPAALGPDGLLARLQDMNALCETFLSAYEVHAPVSRERVALWEALDLLTVVLHCWTKIDARRLPPALLALTEHLRGMGIEASA